MHQTAVRKIDLRILPLLSFGYLLCFLDRVNIAAARIANASTKNNLDESLSLTDFQAQLSISIFFVGYIICEVPSNIALRKFTPRKWIGRIMVTWGIAAFSMAFVQNFETLLFLRLLLGISEAGFFPGVIYYLNFFYTSNEKAFRIALFFSANTVAGIIGGPIAYAISKNLNLVAGLEGWRWIFLVEGAPTILAGIACWLMLPNYPEEANFLSPEERDLIVERLRLNGSLNRSESLFDTEQFKSLLCDPKTYLFCISCLMLMMTSYTIAFSAPVILLEMGFHDLDAQLMTSPVSVLCLITILISSYLSDRYSKRVAPLILGLVIQAIGFLGLILAPTPASKYAFLFVTGLGLAIPLPIFYAWMTDSMQGATKIGILTALANTLGCVGAFVNPFLYPKKDAPDFVLGNSVNIACALLTIVSISSIHLLLQRSKRTLEASFHVGKLECKGSKCEIVFTKVE